MNRVGIFPALVTLANGYCGVLAIYKTQEGHLYGAAFLVLLAMVFDVVDGKVARMARTTSSFGAYLDSLSDAISFGVAPAFLAKVAAEGIFAPKLLALLTILFALGALIRLAKYNVEHASPEGADEGGRPVAAFSGIPTPGAAGVVAGLVFLAYDPQALLDYKPVVKHALAFLCPLLGYLMISSVRYVHVGTRFLRGRRHFGYLFGVVMVLALGARFPEECAALGFLAYGLSGPLLHPFRRERVGADANGEVRIPDGR